MEKSTKLVFFVCLFSLLLTFLFVPRQTYSDVRLIQDEEFSSLVSKIMMFDSMPNGFQIEISRMSSILETSCRPRDLEGWENFGFIELEFPVPALVDDDLVFLSIIKMKDSPGIAARLNSHNYGESTLSGSTCPFYAGLEGLSIEGAFVRHHFSDGQIDSINCIALVMANKIMDMHIKSLTKK